MFECSELSANKLCIAMYQYVYIIGKGGNFNIHETYSMFCSTSVFGTTAASYPSSTFKESCQHLAGENVSAVNKLKFGGLQLLRKKILGGRGSILLLMLHKSVTTVLK